MLGLGITFTGVRTLRKFGPNTVEQFTNIFMRYTWDAVTSVNLNISMVRELRRHLVCTTDSLHEQEWLTLMRLSLFDKVKSLGIDSCLYEIPKNDLVEDMSCSLWPSVAFPESR